MRTLFLFLLAGLCPGLRAQFPAPASFQFSFEYIMLDEWGVCSGETLYGPAYCSHFNWSPPDTSQVVATLDHYLIYQDASPMATATDTFYTTAEGFIGKFYVTAVYIHPSGESDSSNVVYNWELPIQVEEILSGDKCRILFDKRDRQLILRHPGNISWLRIYNLLGTEVWYTEPVQETVDLSPFSPGIYIIESETGQQGRTRQKILIQ